MSSEFGSINQMRFLVNGDPKSHEPEWKYVLDELPTEGQRVICRGNKTICCELDMEDEADHEATFRIHTSSWREHADGTKYDMVTCPSFDLDDDKYNLIFVSRWKAIP